MNRLILLGRHVSAIDQQTNATFFFVRAKIEGENDGGKKWKQEGERKSSRSFDQCPG